VREVGQSECCECCTVGSIQMLRVLWLNPNAGVRESEAKWFNPKFENASMQLGHTISF